MKPLFSAIPQFTREGSYQINLGWDYLETWIADHHRTPRLDLEPDFQRGYVWTPEQKSRYVEYILRGGRSGRVIYFNCVGWQNDYRGPFVIVDGKQRLDAVRGFLRDEVPAFGYLRSKYKDKLRMIGPDFLVNVNNLATRAEVLQWYIDLNTGGTVHTSEEIERVRALLTEEGIGE